MQGSMKLQFILETSLQNLSLCSQMRHLAEADLKGINIKYAQRPKGKHDSSEWHQ